MVSKFTWKYESDAAKFSVSEITPITIKEINSWCFKSFSELRVFDSLSQVYNKLLLVLKMSF